jgi:hypothetical protein
MDLLEREFQGAGEGGECIPEILNHSLDNARTRPCESGDHTAL